MLSIASYNQNDSGLNIFPCNVAETNLSELLNSDHILSESLILFYVDHTVGYPGNTGIQRVTRMIAKSISQLKIDVRFVKWSSSKNKIVYITEQELENLSNWNGPVLTKKDIFFYNKNGNLETVYKEIKENEINWLFVPEVPYINFYGKDITGELIQYAKNHKFKCAYIFYDYNQKYQLELSEDIPKHNEYMKRLQLADKVFAISEFSLNDLKIFTNQNLQSKVMDDWAEALLLPAESVMGPRVTDLTTQSEAEHIILSIGSITPHKNQLSLVKAFDLFCKKNSTSDWKLILLGNIHPLVSKNIEEVISANSKIIFMGPVSDKELKEWYLKCSFTVFPSTLEGFGLPIVESLWFGKPCICANFGAMAEAGSLPGCIGVNTKNLNEIESALTDLINDSKKLISLTQQACHAPLETWHDYTLELLAKLGIKQKKIIWIDVTELAIKDAATGIQRVTKNIAKELLLNPPKDYAVKLIKIVPGSNVYSLAKSLCVDMTGKKILSKHDDQVKFKVGDIFFGLDLTPRILQASNYLIDQRRIGVKFIFQVYDLIPSLHPEFYPDISTKIWFDKWLEFISINGDELICISQSTANDMEQWITNNLPTKVKPIISWSHLGADINTTAPTEGLLNNTDLIFNSMAKRINILMVGTIEPRKGYKQTLDAMDQLWGKKTNINLIIVGKIGWTGNENNINEFQKRLKNHKYIGRNLFWFNTASDEFLEKLYTTSTVLLAASYAEGFGLPLIEASRHKLHVLARDIPVFREIAGEHASYYTASTPAELVSVLQCWINNYKTNKLPLPGQIPWITWKKCTSNIKNILIKGKIYLDCTMIYRYPLHNGGCQRVTRKIAEYSRHGRVIPAILHDDGNFYELICIPKVNDAPCSFKGNLISFSKDDIYFILDTTWNQNIFKYLSPYKSAGLKIGVLYYDVIPLSNKEFCSDEMVLAFTKWFYETLKYCNFFICISEASRKALIQQAEKAELPVNGKKTASFNLGADINKSENSYTPTNSTLTNVFKDKNCYLSVSTIEPRKNHGFVLDSLEILWAKNIDIKYCIIGKIGWKVERLVQRIENHPEYNKRLFMFNNISDDELTYCYKNSKVLIFPSIIEGFGLPILEALKSGLPVLASDTPIHREVGKDLIDYFSLNATDELVQIITDIETGKKNLRKVYTDKIHITTWEESAKELLEKVTLVAK